LRVTVESFRRNDGPKGKSQVDLDAGQHFGLIDTDAA
jgi:hypothetical protein